MLKQKQKNSKNPVTVAVLLLGVVFIVTAMVMVFAETDKIRMVGVCFWSTLVFVLWILGRDSRIHTLKMEDAGKKENVVTILLIVLLILMCTIPMGMSPVWNGDLNGHWKQYEMMTESILKGQLTLDAGVDPRLLEMENPYDPEMREKLGIDFGWDHALYNGKYYMYFGIVPVFLLFLPYRLITGVALAGYKATQVFVAVGIVGIFALFRLLTKQFFKEISFTMQTALSAAMCLVSFWYASSTPSLYCTAITGAITLMIWGLYFFVKAIWGGKDKSVNKQIMLMFCGAWCGALAFGCRPPVALANLLVVPLLCTFLRQHKMDWKLFGKLLFAACPYLIVAAALMTYNYVRFDNPFEFGQVYQLTNTDQSSYGSFLENLNIIRLINGIVENFVAITPLKETFPHIAYSGAFINFPILALPLCIFNSVIRKKTKESGLFGWVAMLIAVPLIITIIDVQWAPFLMERYRMDIYFVMSILCFVMVGFWYSSLKTDQDRRVLSRVITVFAAITALSCCVLWLVPFDDNPAEFFPEILYWTRRVLFLDIGE